MGYWPINGGAVLPIARFGRLEAGWWVEGDGWSMTPRGNLTIGQARTICIHSAAAVRRATGGHTMQIKHIEGATRVIGKSQGYLGLPLRDELIDCPVNGPNTPAMVTAWEPTPDELAKIEEGAPIYLRILGNAHPPVMLFVGDAPK